MPPRKLQRGPTKADLQDRLRELDIQYKKGESLVELQAKLDAVKGIKRYRTIGIAEAFARQPLLQQTAKKARTQSEGPVESEEAQKGGSVIVDLSGDHPEDVEKLPLPPALAVFHAAISTTTPETLASSGVYTVTPTTLVHQSIFASISPSINAITSRQAILATPFMPQAGALGPFAAATAVSKPKRLEDLPS